MTIEHTIWKWNGERLSKDSNVKEDYKHIAESVRLLDEALRAECLRQKEKDVVAQTNLMKLPGTAGYRTEPDQEKE